ncbi:MAG: hypothetical protein ACTHJW_26185 [Streptosporangiaceae bacterium]
MRYTARVIARRIAWLFAVPMAVPLLAVAGCAAPQFTYVADSSAKAYFKVPNYWHKIDDSSLASQLKRSGFTTGGSIWDEGFDAAGIPSASHVLSASVSKPFALALVAPLSQAASSAMSYNLLRDFILPVTSTSRQSATSRGFPLTKFQLHSDAVIKPGAGVHGIREVYSYTYPDGATDTFDQVALTNSDSTMVYLLLVHCLSSCYSKNTNAIDTVMQSFTVRSP